MTTLEVRRERGDLIELFKIEKEIDKITWVSPYTRGPPSRGNRAQLRKETVQNCQQRYNFFSNRVVNNWNSLPDSVVDAPNTNAFKNRVNKFQQRLGKQFPFNRLGTPCPPIDVHRSVLN